MDSKEAQVLWYKQSNSTMYHRCADCWDHLRYSHPSGVPIADDNGYQPADKPYPHAAWCKQRGKF